MTLRYNLTNQKMMKISHWLLSKGFKNICESIQNSRESRKDDSQGEVNEIQKVSFPQNMMLMKILVMVVDLQVTWSRIVRTLKRKMRELDSNPREQTKEPWL